MPALPNVPQVVRMDLQHYVGDDLDAITRTYWKYSGTAPTAANCVTWATAMCASWVTTLAPMTHSSRGLLGVHFTDLTSPTSGAGGHLSTSGGSRSGGDLPAGVCALVNYTISRRYRGGKPRSYYPFGTDTDMNTPQNWAAAFTSALDTALATWAGDVASNAPSGTTISDQVNISYYEGFTSVQNPVTLRYRNVNTLRGAPVVDIIDTTSTNLIYGSQRRRNRK